MRTVKNIENNVAKMSVAQMRKIAPQYGIKNASKYKRVQLAQMLVDAMVEQENAKRAKKSNTTKRFKADKVNDSEVEALAIEMLDGIETLTDEDLFDTNRKVLIRVMKMLHCSKWYRTYDKATMVEKIKSAVA